MPDFYSGRTGVGLGTGVRLNHCVGEGGRKREGHIGVALGLQIRSRTVGTNTVSRCGPSPFFLKKRTHCLSTHREELGCYLANSQLCRILPN